MNNQADIKTDTSHEEDHHHNSYLEVVLFFVGLLAFIIALFIQVPLIQTILYVVTLLLAGYHIMLDGLLDTITKSIRKKKFIPNIHLLMTLAAIGAMIIGDYMEAALLILIFAGAHYLEHYAEDKSSKEITSLLQLHPTTARRITADGETEIVDVSELRLGDHVSILNGDQVPTDGVVLSGESGLDQSAITGESIPVEKRA